MGMGCCIGLGTVSTYLLTYFLLNVLGHVRSNYTPSSARSPRSTANPQCRAEAERLPPGAEGAEGVADAADAALPGRRSQNPSSECRRRSGGRTLLSSGWCKGLQRTLAAAGTP